GGAPVLRPQVLTRAWYAKRARGNKRVGHERHVNAAGGVHRASLVLCGRSSMSSRPCRRQPTAASQVRAATTGGRPIGPVTAWRQPSNHGADEQGSRPRSVAQCFERFFKT